VINVLVAAESAIARTGLEALIGAHDSLRVIQTDASLPLWRRVEDGRAEVLVVDLDRQAVSRTLRELARLPRPPATIFLTDDLRAVRTSEARRAGVLAVLPRGATASELGAAIKAVAAGLIVLHPEGVDALLSPSSLPSAAGATGETLTVREAEVLNIIAEGLGNKEIAARLGISEHTVKFHVASIFTKLKAGSRTEAVAIGVRRGLIMI